MILDFLKKHWRIVCFTMTIDLLLLIIMSSRPLKDFIVVFICALFFCILTTMYRFGFGKCKKMTRISEIQIVIMLFFFVGFSVKFFIRPIRNSICDIGNCLILVEIFSLIFFARKYNTRGCLFKNADEESDKTEVTE